MRSAVIVNLSAFASVWRLPVCDNSLVTFVAWSLTTEFPRICPWIAGCPNISPHPAKIANGRRRWTWTRLPLGRAAVLREFALCPLVAPR
jgi:hypothetical protein